jgi:hypothetical protein
MAWVKDRLSDYVHWLQASYEVEELPESGWSLLTTPFLGLHNDPIEIYLKPEAQDHILLSDDGNTLWELNALGLDLKRSKTRRLQFERVLAKWGVLQSGSELLKKAHAKSFPQAKHDFLQCLQELNEFHHLTTNNVKSLFKDDLYDYLNELSDTLVVSEGVALAGTNLQYMFDLLLSTKQEERVVKAFTLLNQTYLTSFLYAWRDVRTARATHTRKKLSGLVAINDLYRKPDPGLLKEAEANGLYVLRWSQKDDPAVREQMRLAA